MIVGHMKMKHTLALALSSIATLLIAASAQAAPPVKLVLASSFGREVNLTQANLKAGAVLEDLCTSISGDTCQPGKTSTIAGGFKVPESVAGAPDGNVFVADQGNDRIEEFTANGEFVLMFGKGVDPTAANKDVCTATSKDVCGAGAKGTEPGQFDEDPESIAVDPASGDVYVIERVSGKVKVGASEEATFGHRVQKFTADGEFLLEIGKEVNETTKGNLCTKEEKCTGPTEYLVGVNQENTHGAFDFKPSKGNLLTVGGEHDRLYVAGEGSIQEFEPEGSWSGEIVTGTEVVGIAIEPTSNAIYAVYANSNVVHRLNPKGEEISSFAVSPREVGDRVKEVLGIAIDRSSQLALAVFEEPEEGHDSAIVRDGELYEASTGNLLTEFSLEGQQVTGISFNRAETSKKEPIDELFAAGNTSDDVLGYRPLPVAELSTGSTRCVSGSDDGSSATFNCTIEGQVNPYSVAGTTVWFEWGPTCALGSETVKQPLSTVTEVLTVEAMLTGLRPNGTICYRLAGEDKNVQAPERLTAEKKEQKLPAAPPRIVGSPSVSFVKSSSAVMFGELNPENTPTEYAFEYGPCGNLEECSEAARTATLISKVYGSIGATLEVTGLQPATTYRYRLHAINEAGEAECSAAEGCEGNFTTAVAPLPKATTEGTTAIGTTFATVSGTADPDGQPATYAFELGLYAGAATQYGVVQSGSTETIPVRETLPLSGLQPGTEYAYRISVKSGYGTAIGQSVTFTTTPVPVLAPAPPPIALLPLPATKFPTVSAPPKIAKCKRGYTRDKQEKCVRLKKTGKTKKADKAKQGRSRERHK